MMRLALGFVAVLFPLLASACAADKECQDWTKLAVENPAVGCEGACTQAKRFDKYDYHAGLIAAQKSRTGLEKFFRYTARSTIMGAGSDELACHMYALLLQWGDAQFANTLTKSGAKATTRVVGLLDYTAVTDFKRRFPRTYGLVSQHEE
ncbi:hypothetical protein [Zoogloea sp.]